MSGCPVMRPEIPVPELHIRIGQSLVVIGYGQLDRDAKIYVLSNSGNGLVLTELKPTEAKP